MSFKSKKIIAYLTLSLSLSFLLMALWIALNKNTVLPPVFLYIGTTILYIATFAGLLRGIIWTVEHFVKWIQNQNPSDEA